MSQAFKRIVIVGGGTAGWMTVGDVAHTIRDALDLLGRTAQKYIPGRSRPRPKHTVKPHPSAVYKG